MDNYDQEKHRRDVELEKLNVKIAADKIRLQVASERLALVRFRMELEEKRKADLAKLIGSYLPPAKL